MASTKWTDRTLVLSGTSKIRYPDGSEQDTASEAVKATGAEIDTGTNDTKFATPKAIADSNIIRGDAEAHIEDPAGAVTDQDDEARAAIAAILDVLETFGLVEPAA